MSGDNKGRVLIVDDEPNAVKVLSAILSECGYSVIKSFNAESAMKLIDKEDVDTVITDLKMPGTDGMQLFDYVTKNHADIPVIFLTAYGSVESAVHAVTCGAFYYFIKPPDYQKLKSIVARAVEQRCLRREVGFLRKRLDVDNRCRIIGTTAEMLKIFDVIESIKNSTSNVLICGETGTGKELVARAIHFRSIRKNMPFNAVNCAAIPRELIEAELFGHEKGAFTGAVATRIGKFEDAGEGTVILDEIGELELPVQAKLLRVLQEREVERVGSNKKIGVKFRLISLTNRDLKKEVLNGNFREDLFYRINVVQLNVPPLRERPEDIPLLVSEMAKEICALENKHVTFSEEVIESFVSYAWPGNVRQLKNVIERAVVLAKGKTITIKELPSEFNAVRSRNKSSGPLKTLKQIEVQALNEALRECNGNKSKAAKALGISRKALYKRLNDPDFQML